MVAHSWHGDRLEEILSRRLGGQPRVQPSPYLCLPMMSIVSIARECGRRSSDSHPTCPDPCVVCLERKCTVAAQVYTPACMASIYILRIPFLNGMKQIDAFDALCFHEFCTHCALYLCSTNCTSTVANGPPGSIACPLSWQGIVSFVKLDDTRPLVKEIPRNSFSLPFCTCSADGPELASQETPFCKPDFYCTRISPLGSSFRSLSCQRFPSVKFSPGLCMGAPDTSPSLVPRTVDRNLRDQLVRCSRLSLKCSTSQTDGRRWLCSLGQSVETVSSC